MQKITGLTSWKKGILDGKRWGLLLLFLLALVLSVYQLEYYPQTWFDEGWYLQIPKNLVQHGVYAPLSSEGYRPYDTIVSVSPVFYLPMAAAFKMWGVGLWQARAAIVSQSDADLMTPWTLKNGGKDLFTIPRVGVLRTLLLNHVIHHRGQFTVYLRLCDVPLPSVYGPTADAR